MKAKEMFEKLGYKLVDNVWNKNILAYKYIQYEVDFYLIEKTYYFCRISWNDVLAEKVSIEIHKAITQQMKELGWIDD